MFGIVEWINGHPILDGMRCYKTKDKALEAAKKLEYLTKNMPIDVSYTLIELSVEDDA